MEDVAEPSGIEDPATEPDRRILWIALGVLALGAVAAVIRSRNESLRSDACDTHVDAPIEPVATLSTVDANVPDAASKHVESDSKIEDPVTVAQTIASDDAEAPATHAEPAPVEAPPSLYDDPLSVRERRSVPRR